MPALFAGLSVGEIIDNAKQWIREVASESLTGKVTDAETARIRAETTEAIRQAAGDNVDLAGEQIALANQEIDAAREINNTEADAANLISTPNLGKAVGLILLVAVAGVVTFSAVRAFRSD